LWYFIEENSENPEIQWWLLERLLELEGEQ
jgi:hypothetical protein